MLYNEKFRSFQDKYDPEKASTLLHSAHPKYSGPLLRAVDDTFAAFILPRLARVTYVM